MKKIILTTVIGVLLLGLTACGVSESATSIDIPTAQTTLPTSVKYVVIAKQTLQNAPEIADWLNSLPGSHYRGRLITSIIDVKFISATDGWVRQIFVTVELGS